MTAEDEHRPVLLAEAVEALNVRRDGWYVDGTFGRGGHATALLDRLGPDGRLWVLDRDPDAIAAAHERFGADSRVRIRHASFAELTEILHADGATGVDGILLDLGVSSPQLEAAGRGFSFRHDGPLDMRMDSSSGETAWQWLARVDERELVRVLRVYGEERFARRIARAVVRAREAGELPETTLGFADLVAAAVPYPDRHKHPATRTFQALRIAVNGELDALRSGLDQVVELLRTGGRLVVISFHSLEDRMVKRFIRSVGEQRDLPADIPVIPEGLRARMQPVGKAMRPGEGETRGNPRARSAVMRVAERVA
ncbi:16S rRNA (cytosine(1402)-N(4))-methyltransferase RsmH [Aquisalimonas lutea]|uniref:16S rRNA (cytosine(1402)-N(4))-methyltransferase RsmH n=1 Tax=Aquisalimonas lutea TaxID=1327750 RepID=UPI0025B2C042|nr:16S rRNA (cytosine(1402)-N(4))-methyltransferase RsmH [Aquisalimonas lutea]MDN3517406.1 16S rRNA (cytosine(1402)-N(4))-methyltransferase RsmH [Aquisalimonas lutea]